MSTEDKMQAWARDVLGVDEDVYVSITDRSTVTEHGGCPTCGPDYDVEYNLYLSAWVGDDYRYHEFVFESMVDAIQTILDWEPSE